IVCWAAATIAALVLIDRAEAEAVAALPRGRRLAPRGVEALRTGAIVAGIVVVSAVALVPIASDHLGRKVWPGVLPSIEDEITAPGSLRASRELDMTSRPRLSERVVFTVDAPRPEFWRGELFDQFNGRTWSRSDDSRRLLPRRGNTQTVFLDPHDEAAQRGTETRQTFRIETAYSQVVFAAPSAVEVEADSLLLGRPDGTALVNGGGFGKDAVYSVTSRSSLATEADLRSASSDVPAEVRDRYAAAPETTGRVRALAEEITAGLPTTYDKVRAIEAWLAGNTQYSVDAPLSPKGVDVVDHFLFETRLGWCEQVSSSLAVLARSVGIPARLATGFVPGAKDGLSGRFVVRERDAHAWTEIYFAGIGWQGFDPTASVPLAGEAGSARSWIEYLRAHALQIAVVLGLVAWLVISAPRLLGAYRRHQARRRSWAIRSQTRLERVGQRAGRARHPSETPREYAHAVAAAVGDPRLTDVGDVIDHEIFSATGAAPAARAAADAVLAESRRRRN
ncbi:MAG: transglutaminaseTgpA domain-containing protein, partial [Acidimicrobiia bacterium]